MGCWLSLYVDVKGSMPEDGERERLFRRMEIIWASKPNTALAIWTADLLGAEGRFDVMFADGWRVRARVGRCGPCGGVTFRLSCRSAAGRQSR
jgi:hypothetical protein